MRRLLPHHFDAILDAMRGVWPSTTHVIEVASGLAGSLRGADPSAWSTTDFSRCVDRISLTREVMMYRDPSRPGDRVWLHTELREVWLVPIGGGDTWRKVFHRGIRVDRALQTLLQNVSGLLCERGRLPRRLEGPCGLTCDCQIGRYAEIEQIALTVPWREVPVPVDAGWLTSDEAHRWNQTRTELGLPEVRAQVPGGPNVDQIAGQAVEVADERRAHTVPTHYPDAPERGRVRRSSWDEWLKASAEVLEEHARNKG